MTQSKVKQHLSKASNMSFSDIVSGSTKLVGKTISLGFKTIGASVYVGNKLLDSGLQISKAAYNESKKGYNQVDEKVDELLSSPNQEQEQPKRSYPVGSDAVNRQPSQPQQMEFDFE